MHVIRTIFFCFGILAGIWGVAAPVQAQPERSGSVYVLPIKGPINDALLYVVRRGVDEAVRHHAQAIVLEMDTPGGKVSAAEGIIRTLGHTDIPTYTLVKKEAFSAGALIALSTKHIYMTDGSVIGAATPFMMGPGGGVQDLPDEVREKMTSAVAALARAAAEQGGHDKLLAEAMVRADLEYARDGTVISEKGRLLTLTNQEAEKQIGPAGSPLLSEGTVKNLDAMLKVAGLEGAEKHVLQITAAEKVARAIAAIAPFLMMIGLGALWMELKTPGFGFFGIIGISCLLLFFFGHHIAGLAGMEDLLVFFAGVALLALEIFVIPGFGIAGISGLLLILFSLLNAMVEHIPGKLRPISFSPEAFSIPLLKLSIGLGGAVGLIFLLAKFFPQTRLFQSVALNETISETAVETDATEWLGKEGMALSSLRPSGTARFGDEKLRVLTRGDYLPPKTPLRIVEVHGNRIFVEPINADS